MQNDFVFSRTGHILNRKLKKYLLPTVATGLALSPDEFVDSILVANLLDLRAMTVVSVASPIVLLIAAVYILFGVGGTALATFTGYCLCLVVLIVLFLGKKIRLYAAMPKRKDFRSLKEIAAQGGANAIVQIGYAVKFTFFNQLALHLGGTAALETFAVAKQLISIIGIGLLLEAPNADSGKTILCTVR